MRVPHLGAIGRLSVGLLLLAHWSNAGAGECAYLAGSGNLTSGTGSSLLVVETATHTVVSAVPLGTDPGGMPHDVAVASSGEVAYVPVSMPNAVRLIDTESKLQIDSIPLPVRPTEIAVTPDSQKLFVTSSGGDALLIIDAVSGSVLQSIEMDTPNGVAVMPDGLTALVAVRSNQIVHLVDTTTNSIVDSIPYTGRDPVGVAPFPAGPFALVTELSNRSVSRINLDTLTIEDTLVLSDSNFIVSDLAITPSGDRAYISHVTANNEPSFVVDLDLNLLDTIPLRAAEVAVSTDGAAAWFVQTDSSDVSIVNTSTNEITESIDFTASPSTFIPQGIAIQDFLESDTDCVADDFDNCQIDPNPDQRDTDSDGIGNACDPDLNNDCIVNLLDLLIFRGAFLTDDANADFNGDGTVNLLDLLIFRRFFLNQPGPSATGCAAGL